MFTAINIYGPILSGKTTLARKIVRGFDGSAIVDDTFFERDEDFIGWLKAGRDDERIKERDFCLVVVTDRRIDDPFFNFHVEAHKLVSE